MNLIFFCSPICPVSPVSEPAGACDFLGRHSVQVNICYYSNYCKYNSICTYVDFLKVNIYCNLSTFTNIVSLFSLIFIAT